MCNLKYSLKAVQAIALQKGYEYQGSPRIKTRLKEPWKCKNGHVRLATVRDIKKSTYCPKCSPYQRLDESEELQARLGAAEVELIGPWRGAKHINHFHCLNCTVEWEELGTMITNHGLKCPNCYPRRGKRLYQRLLEQQRKGIALGSPLPSFTTALPHPG